MANWLLYIKADLWIAAYYTLMNVSNPIQPQSYVLGNSWFVQSNLN